MRAAIYARFSSDNQREESITAQLRACREYCARRDYSIVAEYFDEAMTATNDNRPQYREMIKEAQKRAFDVIVMHKLDRGARNEYDYYINKAKLQRVGVYLEYATQQFDMNTPEGQLMENQLVGIAAYYSRNLAKEVRKGQKENALMCKFNGGKPPLGLKVEDGFYKIDESTAPAVKLIFEMYAEGHTYPEIANELDRLGYKSARGQSFKKNSIHDILKNERYSGTYVYGRTKTEKGMPRNNHQNNGEPIKKEGAFPAIISPVLWRDVQSRLGARALSRLHARRLYLLTGRVFCGECGAPMQGSVEAQDLNGKRYSYNYYRCAKQKKGECSAKKIRADYLEDIIIENLNSVAENPQITADIALKTSVETDSTNTDKKAAINALKREERNLQKSIDNLLSAIERGEFSDIISERLNNRRQELFTVRKRLDDLAKNDEVVNTAMIKNILKQWKKAKSPSKRLISSIIKKITITKGEIEIKYFWQK